MEKLIKLVKDINKIDIDLICQNLFKRKGVQDFIIEKEQKRLSERGEDIRGIKIRTYKAVTPNSYSHSTNILKSKNTGIAAIPKHVTLYETGAFYKSFSVLVQKTYAEMIGDKTKMSLLSKNLDVTNVLGLAQNELSELEDYIKPEIIKQIKL